MGIWQQLSILNLTSAGKTHQVILILPTGNDMHKVLSLGSEVSTVYELTLCDVAYVFSLASVKIMLLSRHRIQQLWYAKKLLRHFFLTLASSLSFSAIHFLHTVALLPSFPSLIFTCTENSGLLNATTRRLTWQCKILTIWLRGVCNTWADRAQQNEETHIIFHKMLPTIFTCSCCLLFLTENDTLLSVLWYA